jgi:hypothetical protein
MERGQLIVLVQEDPTESALTRAAVERDGGSGCRCQPVERLTTAVARIAGGDVDLILMRCPPLISAVPYPAPPGTPVSTDSSAEDGDFVRVNRIRWRVVGC